MTSRVSNAVSEVPVDRPIRMGYRAKVAPGATRAEMSARLWAMTPAERVEALHAGRLTFPQCFEWARRRPDEVPLIDGEFAFIAAFTPEVAEVTAAKGGN
jgi:hypothetical protein